MSTRDAIRYATVDGARAAGLGGVTGSLVPGMQADVIVLRTDRPNIFPINDPIGAVVWGMDTSNVDHVFVGGRRWCATASSPPTSPAPGPGATAARERVAAAAGLAVGGVREPHEVRRPSSALTSFVVASRYMPVYIALALLVVVAAIWAPAR